MVNQRNIFYNQYFNLTRSNVFNGIKYPKGNVNFWQNAFNVKKREFEFNKLKSKNFFPKDILIYEILPMRREMMFFDRKEKLKIKLLKDIKFIENKIDMLENEINDMDFEDGMDYIDEIEMKDEIYKFNDRYFYISDFLKNIDLFDIECKIFNFYEKEIEDQNDEYHKYELWYFIEEEEEENNNNDQIEISNEYLE